MDARTADAFVYPAWVRLILAMLFLWRWGGVGLVSLLVLFATDPPVTPPMLVRLCLVWVVTPAVLAGFTRRWFRAQTRSEPDRLIAELPGLTLAIPRERIAGARPWQIPVPRPGLRLLLRDGGVLRERIEVAAPRLWARLHGIEISSPLSPMARGTLAFSEARARQPKPQAWYLAAKFVVFPLLPAGLLFRVHQLIAYGSVWGEYYQRGLAAYLHTGFVYYGTIVVYVLLFAGILRALFESALWLLAIVTAEQAERLRRWSEYLREGMYYLGVILFLAIRFFGWG
ncbi:MAG: hypothetical protein KatS3mg077_2105 [Candidatus Binatia bacterium]|nr:MAG: hypothetical protein KatS3mg077_2105 [Candidatus Binatia bacterium]